MKSRMLVGALLIVAGFATATTGHGVSSGAQSTLVNLNNPVKVGSHFLMGYYLIVHDYDRDARGEPCTTIYAYDTSKGRGDKVVEFMCIPSQRAAADKFTMTTRLDWDLSTTAPIIKLIDYQFAGDTAIHGVPDR